MKLYVEKVLPRSHISLPPAASDPIAKSIALSNRDKAKQDALYVGLSDDAEVINIPSSISREVAEKELERTKRSVILSAHFEKELRL